MLFTPILSYSFCRPCLLRSGHRSGLGASGVLWLSINSGVWSISLQLLQNNWAQRAMFKPGLVFNKRSFFCFSLGAMYNIHFWTDQTDHTQRIVLSCIIITLFSLLFPLQTQTSNICQKCCRHLVLHNSSTKWCCDVWFWLLDETLSFTLFERSKQAMSERCIPIPSTLPLQITWPLTPAQDRLTLMPLSQCRDLPTQPLTLQVTN